MTAGSAKEGRRAQETAIAQTEKLTTNRLVKPCEARLWVVCLESDSRRRAELILKMSRVRDAKIAALLLLMIMRVHVVRDAQSLTPHAAKALKAWTFAPAPYQGPQTSTSD